MEVKCMYEKLKLSRIIIYECEAYSRASIIAYADEKAEETKKRADDKSIGIYADNGEKLFEGTIEQDMTVRDEQGCRLIINAVTGVDIAFKNINSDKSKAEISADLSSCRVLNNENNAEMEGYDIIGADDYVRVGDIVSFKGKSYRVTRMCASYDADKGDERFSCDCRIEPI